MFPRSSPEETAGRRIRRRAGVLATLLTVSVGALGLTVAPAALSPAAEAIAIPAGGGKGAWSGLIDWPVIAIHAVLSPEGTVVTWGNGIAAPPYNQGTHYYDVWYPSAGTGPGSHVRTANPHDKLFCSGQYVSPETGEILVFGGTKYPDGSAQLASFAPGTNTLTDLQNPMKYPRWYPTSTLLPDGRALVQGGTDVDFDGEAQITPELYTPGSGWTELTGASRNDIYGDDDGIARWYYPRTWVIPDGRIFVWNQDKMFYVDVDANGGTGAIYGVRSWNRARSVGSSAVMYRPGRILLVGGHLPGSTDATGQASVIDVRGASPVVSATSSMKHPREWADATVLPDGRVLVTGGSAKFNEDVGVALNPEIWDPDTGEWTELAAGAEMRLYHSSSLLLPDGSVLVAGGGEPGPKNLTNAEIFYPPYLYDSGGGAAQRPDLAATPEDIAYDAQFTAHLASTAPVSRVTLIKTGSVTHSFDMEQRFLELDFSQSGATLSIDAPGNARVATPGHYMLFALDENGVPSVGRIVRISPDTDEPDVPTPPPPPPPPPPQPPAPPAPPQTAPPATPPPVSRARPAKARLRVAVKSPRRARRGRTITYRFTVRNVSPRGAKRITLSARLPKALRLTKRTRGTARFQRRRGRLIWRVGNLGPRRSRSVVVRFAIPRKMRATRIVTTARVKGTNTTRAARRKITPLRR